MDPQLPPAAHVDSAATFRKLGPAGILGVLWSVAPAVCGIVLLANLGALSGWLKSHETFGLAGYIAVFVVSAGLGLLPTYAQAILGGWVFGFALGFPASLAGFAGGSLIGYVVATTVSHHRVQEAIDRRPIWRAVREALVEGGSWRTLGIVTLVRLPPNSPFAVTNLILSTAGVRLLPYTLGTILGMAPRTGIVVFLAAAAASSGAADIQSFVSSSRKNVYLLIGGIAAMIIVLGIIGAIANKAIARVTGGKPVQADVGA
jgi:uncharacterized membrane protein YdjX (TVP38/TMEM64 family)